jgi:hypothetical protein
MNQMKSMAPTEAELQAAMKAEQKRKDIQVDNVATEKIKKFQDQVASATEKQNNKPGSGGFTVPEKNQKPSAESETTEKPIPEKLPPASSSHIDFKV